MSQERPKATLQTSSSYDGNTNDLYDLLDHSYSGTFLPWFRWQPLTATFLTVTEVAASVTSCSKVSWKSFSEAWPRAQPSEPLQEFPKQPSLRYLSVSCPEPWWILQRSTWKLDHRKIFFMSTVKLFFHRYLYTKGPSKMSPFLLVLPHEYTDSPELRPPSPFFSFAHTDEYLSSALDSSPWTETATCPVSSRSTVPPFSHVSYVNHHFSQTSSRTLSHKCSWRFIYHIPEQTLALNLIFSFCIP